MIHLGLVGYPLLQSLSPTLHGAALREMGLEGEYRLYPVPPGAEHNGASGPDAGAHPPGDENRVTGEAGLRLMLKLMYSGEVQGLNVTLPYKQRVLPLLDNLTQAAAAIGAVNTIYCQDGRLWGDNTDAPGFLKDLGQVFPSLQSSSAGEPRALVLGAGGAARAVAYALVTTGWRLVLAARRPEPLRALVQSLQNLVKTSNPAIGQPGVERMPVVLSDKGPEKTVTSVSLTSEGLKGLLQDPGSSISLIVNATSAGMIPYPEISPWPLDIPLPVGVCVYDLVYKPRETNLMRMARQAGLSTANGLGMLVEQAALALERWLERPAPREAMRAAVAIGQDGV